MGRTSRLKSTGLVGASAAATGAACVVLIIQASEVERSKANNSRSFKFPPSELKVLPKIILLAAASQYTFLLTILAVCRVIPPDIGGFRGIQDGGFGCHASHAALSRLGT